MADMKTAAAATSLVFALGLICSVRPGVAQQADSARQRPDSSVSAAALKKLSIEQLMDLQVTSVSKRPERLSQTASAIQVITQQDIRRSGASSLAEALRLASNLRSEEHTSELQSRLHLVCRLLLEKKKKTSGAKPRSWTLTRRTRASVGSRS